MSASDVPSSTSAAAKEYRNRLWMGLVMVLAACGVLVVDQLFAPYYPCLFVSVLLLGLVGTCELHHLLAAHPRPPRWLCLLAVAALLMAGWPAQLGLTGPGVQPWRDILATLVLVVLLVFLWEMWQFQGGDGAVLRIALLVWMACYLGLLPCFFAQLRWWPTTSEMASPDRRGVIALALVIFVPKCGDIGAYFTGRFLGRHRMTPLLSPKKTWEGLAGGLLASALIAVLINRAAVPVLGSDLEAILFGLIVGTAGVLGDLAESLIKRDCRQKDASHSVPGFGGILDVVDSVLFAAPVAYAWLHLARSV